jgi:hypothetical protein
MKRSALKRGTTALPKKREEPRRTENPWEVIFPTEDDIKKEPIVVRVFKDGRECCNLLTKAGKDEYFRRIRVMWERQGKRCCLENDSTIKDCPGKLTLGEATFEHQDGRGMGGGHRDDRIEKPDPKTGKMKPYNGCAHWNCNRQKASRRINYNEGLGI